MQKIAGFSFYKKIAALVGILTAVIHGALNFSDKSRASNSNRNRPYSYTRCFKSGYNSGYFTLSGVYAHRECIIFPTYGDAAESKPLNLWRRLKLENLNTSSYAYAGRYTRTYACVGEGDIGSLK